jgi:AcrR family transcriptional regulator
MARAGLTSASVVEAAAELADAEGLEAVTLAKMAGRLGVRAPSLYAHVDGLDDLRSRLAARGADQLADELSAAAAGRAGEQALSAVAHAYRSYAQRHQGSYAALQRASATRSEQYTEAATRVVDVVLAVLRGYGLEGEQALHMVRALRSALHGFVSLEAQHGFGLDLSLDDSFAALVAMFDRGFGGEG